MAWAMIGGTLVVLVVGLMHRAQRDRRAWASRLLARSRWSDDDFVRAIRKPDVDERDLRASLAAFIAAWDATFRADPVDARRVRPDDHLARDLRVGGAGFAGDLSEVELIVRIERALKLRRTADTRFERV